MNPLAPVLSYPLTKALVWALVQFIWQGLAVWVAFEIVMLFLHRSRANVRYLAACGILMIMAFLFFSTLSASWKTLSEYQSIEIRFGGGARALSSSRDNLAIQEAPEHAPGFLSLMVSPSLTLGILAVLEAWLPFWVIAWSSGVFVLSLRLVAGWIYLRRLVTRSVRPATEVLMNILSVLKRKIKISRPVRLLESSLTSAPMVLGWIRPVILLPASALTGLSPGEWEAILAHELAHIRRYDHVVNAFQLIMETVFYYHPAVWRISGRIRRERENCCDDLAVEACGNALTYARALSALEEMRFNAPQMTLAASGGTLLSRIKRIIAAPDFSTNQSSRRTAFFLVVIQVFLLTALYHLSAYTLPRARSSPVASLTEGVSRRIRVIVGNDQILLDGKPVSSDDLAKFLEGLADPARTVLEIAPENGDVKLSRLIEQAERIRSLAGTSGLRSIAYTGWDPRQSLDGDALAGGINDPGSGGLSGRDARENAPASSGADSKRNKDSASPDLEKPNLNSQTKDPNLDDNRFVEEPANEEYLYAFTFDNPWLEGWEPLPIAAGTYVDNVMAPVPAYVALAATADSQIIIENKDKDTVFGTWQMKAQAPLKDCEGGYVYKARYFLATDQEDASKAPLARLRWSDSAAVSSASFIVDKGENAPGTQMSAIDSYFFISENEAALGQEYLLSLDMVDFTSKQSGSLFCEGIDVARFRMPEGGEQVASVDLSEDYSSWAKFSTTKMDEIQSGVDEKGLWLESPGPPGSKEVHFGGWGSIYDPEGPMFQPDSLYKAVFTLSCEDFEAQEHLPMIRFRVGNASSDWIASREIRQIPGMFSHMPGPEGKEYVLFFPSPPSLSGVKGAVSDTMCFSFDIIDGEKDEFGRVYLSRVDVYQYPLSK